MLTRLPLPPLIFYSVAQTCSWPPLLYVILSWRKQLHQFRQLKHWQGIGGIALPTQGVEVPSKEISTGSLETVSRASADSMT